MMLKRSNPWTSRLGWLLAVGLLAGLGLSLWVDGGLAFSPGAVTGLAREGVTLQGFKSHAEFEQQCRLCHQPLRATLGELCLACHTEITAEIGSGGGLHARLENAARCQVCHSDHRGRDFNPTLAAFETFDHELARFSLAHHQENYDGTQMACTACHDPADYARVADARCLDCHAQHDAAYMQEHVSNYGEICQDCHNGGDELSSFDHSQVFPLEGRHGEIECVACHANRVFAGTPRLCVECHPEPQEHAGLFGLECEACHTTRAWSPATLREHSFPLQHGLENGEPATACVTCHPMNYSQYTCYGCHEHQQDETARKHLEEGISAAELPACLECHPDGREAEEEGDDD